MTRQSPVDRFCAPTVARTTSQTLTMLMLAATCTALLSHVASAQTTTRRPVPAAMLAEIDALLPEGVPISQLHPELLSTSINPNLILDVAGSVRVTFVTEGAGYRNAMGYFLFNQQNRVTQAFSIFPNASLVGSGGNLVTGDTVDLGSFPAGTRLGFFIISNGFPTYSVPDPAVASRTYYTVDSLNPQQNRHVALIASRTEIDGRRQLVMGMEDLPLSSGDRDYNDVVFLVDVSPDAALAAVVANGNIPLSFVPPDEDGDGVPDSQDLYPTDPLRAFRSVLPAEGEWYMAAFEDQFPEVGDGDYNDFICAYQITQVTDKSGKVKDLTIVYRSIARGAADDHAFRHRIRYTNASVAGTLERQNAAGETIGTVSVSGANGAVDLLVFPSTRDAISDTGSTFTNTVATRPMVQGHTARASLTFATAIATSSLEVPPFDPYLLVPSRNVDIHLPGKPAIPGSKNPTPTFVNSQGYPFAMLVPANWSWPQERVLIDTAFDDFATWRQSAGKADWYRRPTPNRVIVNTVP